MPWAKSFRDLDVYQRARAGAREVFQLSRAFPPEERYSLTDQMRRSSRAVICSRADEFCGGGQSD